MSKLEKVTHVSLIVVSLLATIVLVRQHFFPQTVSTHSTALVGKRFAISGLTLPRRPAIVVAIRSDCQFCTASLPFYRQLGNNRGSVPLFFLSSEPAEKLREFVDGAGITYDGIASADLRQAGISVTPAMAIIDSEGTVKQAFSGKLSEHDAKAVLALVNKEML